MRHSVARWGVSATVRQLHGTRGRTNKHVGPPDHQFLLHSGPVQAVSATRSYNSRIAGSTGLGGKWVAHFGDYRLAEEGDDVALVVNATSKRVFTWNGSGYTSPADSSLTLVADSGNSQFVLTDWATGEVNKFHDFQATHEGFLKEITTLAWQSAGKDGIAYTYNSSHQITQITTAEDQEHNLVFSYTGNLITKIELRTGSDTSTRIRQVEYTYYDSLTHSSDVGSDNDLVQVKLSALKTGGSVGTSGDWIVRYYQYRYDANGLLKMIFSPADIQRLIDDRSDISTAAGILEKGDDDDNGGNEDHAIKEYAGRRFTYYTVDLKTDNSGAGTQQDPKCVTVWASSGENLQSKYGGSNADEVDSGEGKYLVKTETVGGCSSCGGGSAGLTHEYFYMQLDHGTPDPNEVVWMVVEDISDANGNGIVRKVFGLNDTGIKLREATITDPAGTPEFWCRSIKLEESGQKLNRLAETRTPAAHNVSSSTVDEFLNPSHNGDYSNDTATLNSSAGLIEVFEYNTSGDPTGALVKRGRTGTAYYVSATDYYGDTNENRKHLVTATYAYPAEETSRTASSRITT
ncbi:MAG: hypothetical protein FJ276_36455, partial [Planctomycetes bacterium]|nr:hypothetical protein [Planctomycetota bacterium]